MFTQFFGNVFFCGGILPLSTFHSPYSSSVPSLSYHITLQTNLFSIVHFLSVFGSLAVLLIQDSPVDLQTLLDTTPALGKINRFSKILINF